MVGRSALYWYCYIQLVFELAQLKRIPLQIQEYIADNHEWEGEADFKRFIQHLEENSKNLRKMRALLESGVLTGLEG